MVGNSKAVVWRSTGSMNRQIPRCLLKRLKNHKSTRSDFYDAEIYSIDTYLLEKHNVHFSPCANEGPIFGHLTHTLMMITIG